MKALFQLLVGLCLLAAAVAGRWLGHQAFAPYAMLLLAAGLIMVAALAIRATSYRSGTPWPQADNQPRPLRLSALDYLKAAVGSLDAFRRTYAVEPGLYYTGEHYDRDAPLLVTANYHLSVFLVVRRARALNARLLVIDSDGINVWCSAGKGRFSNAEILKQLQRYDRPLLSDGRWLTLILPKFGMSGVDIRALREHDIKPVVGPLYAKDLDAYLAAPPYRDRAEDRVHFGLQSRLFTWLPGLLQFLRLALFALVFFLGAALIWEIAIPWEMVGLTAILATAYPLLFPWLPGQRFAVKGLSLAGLTSLALGAGWVGGLISPWGLTLSVLFVWATALFFALSYTGNSAVSNSSKVRREIARFLPLDVLLYLASLVAYLIREVQR